MSVDFWNDEPIAPRARVIVDNDFGGDPDGLFQLAHHLLSPSVDVRAILASQHYPRGFYGAPGSVERSVAEATELLATMGLTGRFPVLPGGADAAQAIVAEAMRDGQGTPLFLACGAGLTSAAAAYALEPRIADHLTLIWIGGPEYPGSPPPPGRARMEYNLGIDLEAARTIFEGSEIPLWQVPRNAYRQALVSYYELRERMGAGALTQFLLGRLDGLMRRADRRLGEAYVLGDSPLVLLTALQSSWEAAPSSSGYVEIPSPRIQDDGSYGDDPSGRRIRVYVSLDIRLMMEDFYAKVAARSRLS